MNRIGYALLCILFGSGSEVTTRWPSSRARFAPCRSRQADENELGRGLAEHLVIERFALQPRHVQRAPRGKIRRPQPAT